MMATLQLLGLLILIVLAVYNRRQARKEAEFAIKVEKAQIKYLVSMRHLLLDIQQENHEALESDITVEQLIGALERHGNRLGVQIRENLCDQIENLLEFYSGNTTKNVREDLHNVLKAYQIIPKRRNRRTK